jgi:hypothetical protein
MTQIHALINHYVLGIAKKAVQFVAVAVRYVARLKVRWYERLNGTG